MQIMDILKTENFFCILIKAILIIRAQVLNNALVTNLTNVILAKNLTFLCQNLDLSNFNNSNPEVQIPYSYT